MCSTTVECIVLTLILYMEGIVWAVVENAGADMRGIEPSEFQSRFLKICQEHRRDGRAYAFAFLLLDERHPHVVKVLTDGVYWEALDELAGDRLTVFSFFVPRAVIDGREHGPAVTPAGRGKSRGKNSLKMISQLLELDKTLALPAILFFQVAEGKVIDLHHAEISDDDVESAFNDIRVMFDAVTTATARVLPENRANDRELFNLVKDEVAKRSRSLRVMKRLRQGAPVMGAVGFAKMLLGI
jgi:hypothetical protein